jgi:NADPH2:quinone reductase
MAKAMRIHGIGGPEVFVEDEIAVGAPGPGQARIKQTACGLNFLDTYHRGGAYPLRLPLPAILGQEGAGIVAEVGPGVSNVKPGDRVVYSGQPGAYCDERLVAAERLQPIPAGISDVQAAAVFNKGMTAEYLLRRAYPVKPGETILVHAAAGAVGLILCQWAKHLGAIVIGTVSTEAKAATARANGCDHAILYTREKFPERVRALTNGVGVPVVYDAVGKDTFQGSMDCLRPRGYLVCFGEASGRVPPVDPHTLMDKGSIFLTRASMLHYNITAEDYRTAANALWDVIAKGAVKIHVNQTYRLADVGQAHRDLEARKTTGSTVLLP